jgi:ribosomal-protein-alanine N-acetyltransferase
VNGWHLGTISPADLDFILAIEQHSFQWPWGRISFEEELGCRSGFGFSVKSTGADTDNPVIAYVFLRLIVDELHILKIAVTPAWRGQGVATWLLSRCFELGAERGADSACLEVRPSNIPAHRLYQKLGFAVNGRRKNYYADTKEDALLMTRNLKEDT